MGVGRNQAKLQAKRNQLGTTTGRQKKLAGAPRSLYEQRYTWPLEGERVVDQTLVYEKYQNSSMGGSKIYSSGVGNSHLANGSINFPKIADAEVGDQKIYNAGVGNSHLKSSSVDFNKIGNSQVGDSKIYGGGVNSGHLAGALFGPSPGSYGLRVLSGGGSSAASAADHTHSSTSFIQRSRDQRKEILLKRSRLRDAQRPKGLREAYERIDLLGELLLDALSLLLDYEDMTADEREEELEKDKPSTRAYKHMFSVDDGGDQEDYQLMVEGGLNLQGEGPMDRHMRNLFHSHSHPHTQEEGPPLRRLA